MADGSCAQIYAYAEEYEPSFLIHDLLVRAVKIWHNNSKESLQTQFKTLINYDNDYVVAFKSNVSFSQFCENFSNSDYNQASNYCQFSHNCANAANYALKLAGIILPVHLIKLTTILPSPAWRVPTTILTPYDLFNICKDYKVITQKKGSRPLSHIDFKLDLASTKLHFWSKSSNNAQQKHCIDELLSAVGKALPQRQHHAEFYLKALIKISDRMMHHDSMNENDDDHQLAHFFKERKRSKLSQYGDQFLNRVVLFFLLILVAGAVDYNLGYSVTTLSVILLSLISCCCMLSTVDIKDDDSSKIIETPLSRAMSNLIAV